MDKPFIEYLEGLLRISGIKADDPKLTELKEKLADFSLGEENQRLVNDNVMTREAAKSNSEIFNHVKATILDGIDKDHASIMEQLELSEEEKGEFKNIKTKERTTALFNKIKEKHKKALDDLPKGTGKEEIAKIKETFQKQLEDAHNAVKEKEGELSRITQAHESQLTNLELSGIMKSKNYSTKYDKSHALIIADTLLKEALLKEQIKLVRDANGITIKKMVDDVETDYFVNNEKVDLDGFVTTILSKNNLLAAQETPKLNGIRESQDTPVPQGAKEMSDYYATLKDAVAQ